MLEIFVEARKRSGFQKGSADDGEFGFLHEFAGDPAEAFAEGGGHSDHELDSGFGVIVHEVFKIGTRDHPILGGFDDGDRTDGGIGIEEVHFANPFALMDWTEEDFAVVIAADGMKQPADDEKQFSMGFALGNERIAGKGEMEISVGAECVAVFFGKCGNKTHGREVRAVQLIIHVEFNTSIA